MPRPATAAPGALPILMYHAVGAPGDPDDRRFRRYVIAESLLGEHLSALAGAGLRGVGVAELLAASDTGAAADLVGLTFDDAFTDFARAVPLLAREGFRATVYAPTGHLATTARWLPGSPRRILDAAGLRALADGGFEVGSHSHTHAHLDELDDAAASAELTRSRDVLTDALGAPPAGVCYPFGHASATTRRLARAAGYRYGCGVGRRLSTPASDRFALDRLEITGDVDPQRLLAMVAGRAPSVGARTPPALRAAAGAARRARAAARQRSPLRTRSAA